MKTLDGSMPIYNHILPKINLYSANVFSSYKLFGFNLSGKLGLAFYSLGDKSILDFYKKIHPNAKDSRLFPLAGFNLSKSEVINNSISITGMIDLATEAPEAEALFINVKRMMGKPYWSGNPNLYQPFRTSLRVSFGFPYVTMDLYSSYIFNYVYLATKKVGMQNYETFGNVNALLLGTNLQLKYKYLESNLTYTYGQNLSNDQPLIEILPLQISNTLKLPELYGAKIYLKHTYESAQKRIDANFGEKVSSVWNRIDAGVSYDLKNLMASIEVENLLNHTYSKSLSYVRNPFASGMRVIEPGRSIRLSLRYIY
jgi:iron complex outermembrane receptor protein